MSNFSFSVSHIFQFRLWPYRGNCHAILRQSTTLHPYRITRLIDYQDGSRGSTILRIVSYLKSLLSSKGQNPLYTSQILLTDINIRLRYNYFRFRKKISAVLEFLIWSQPRHRIRHFLAHWCIKFYQNRTTVGGVIMSYRFSTWRPLWHNFTSGFGLGNVGLFTTVKVYR